MKNKHLRRVAWITLLLILLAGVILLALAVGETRFSIPELVRILKSKSGMEYSIVYNIRLPRILLGLATGGALSLSGALLQGIYRNPLVEPYTLGISGGAALGVAVTIVFGLDLSLGTYMLPFSGFAGALAVVFLVYFLAIGRSHFNINRMLLFGVMISFMASSAMMLLMAITSAENLHSIIYWIMGSLDEPDMILIRTALVSSVAGLIISYMFANQLNALRLGVTRAKHLGVNTDLTIRILFIIASLLTGICVSIVGVIGFVGLIIPHLMRLLIGSDYRILLLTSFIGGSIFVIACDLVSRTIIAPNELPIGVITGMVGGLVFIVVLSRSKFKIQ